MVKLTRHESNPILTAIPENPFEAQNVSNSGAIIHDGKVHLLYRAEGHEQRCETKSTWPVTSLGLAISGDGIHIDERRPEPVITKEPDGEFGEHGIQDPRITKIGDTYYIVTAGVSRWGDRLILYTTKDFKRFRKEGVMLPEHEMRTAGMFPQKFGDDFCFLLRPQPNMWIGYTKDFKEFHDMKLMFEIKRGSWYGRKLGMCCVPIRQEDAWFLIWHGKADTMDGTYSLGAMWLDLEDPSKIIKVQEQPILKAEKEWECVGYFPNVAYACGAVEIDDKYYVYYGGADRVLALATVPVEECLLKNQ